MIRLNVTNFYDLLLQNVNVTRTSDRVISLDTLIIPNSIVNNAEFSYKEGKQIPVESFSFSINPKTASINNGDIYMLSDVPPYLADGNEGRGNLYAVVLEDKVSFYSDSPLITNEEAEVPNGISWYYLTNIYSSEINKLTNVNYCQNFTVKYPKGIDREITLNHFKNYISNNLLYGLKNEDYYLTDGLFNQCKFKSGLENTNHMDPLDLAYLAQMVPGENILLLNSSVGKMINSETENLFKDNVLLIEPNIIKIGTSTIHVIKVPFYNDVAMGYGLYFNPKAITLYINKDVTKSKNTLSACCAAMINDPTKVVKIDIR